VGFRPIEGRDLESSPPGENGARIRAFRQVILPLETVEFAFYFNDLPYQLGSLPDRNVFLDSGDRPMQTAEIAPCMSSAAFLTLNR
jgi:hypothetical protein